MGSKRTVEVWHPEPGLVATALRRCFGFLERLALQKAIAPTTDILDALAVSCYYQGVNDAAYAMDNARREGTYEEEW